MKKGYTITVDNSSARSHNVNIDYPTYFKFAYSEEEAVGYMILSDFEFKDKKIFSITVC